MSENTATSTEETPLSPETEETEEYTESDYKKQAAETVKDRIERAKRSVREKEFGDYEALKAKAAKYDEQQEKNKSELQRVQERAKKAEKERDALSLAKEKATWIKAASEATGVPEDALHGDTEEAVIACAERFKKHFTKNTPPEIPGDGKQPNSPPTTGDWIRDNQS
jgi:membrane protein involved in colicin uptake